MIYVTTNAYKTLVARVIMGETGIDLKPATFKVGNGATFNGSSPNPATPADTDLANTIASAPATPTRSGVRISSTGTIPGAGTATTVNEVGLFTASGVMIARMTMPNTTFTAPANLPLTVGLQAEYA